MNVGMKVIERESADANRVAASDISAIGMTFKARRGPVAAAVQFYSPTDDRRIWGELGSAYQAGYVRRGLFANCAEYGAKIYGVRVVGSGAVAATKTLNDGQATPAPAWIVTSAYLNQDSPGADGNNTYVEVQMSIADSANHRDLLVYYKGPKDSAPSLVESYVYQDNATIVNTVAKQSRYIKVALTNANAQLPAVLAMTALTAGVDGVAPSDSDYVTAYSKLNGLPIAMVMNPDATSLATAQSLQTYVEGRGNVIGIHTSPQSMALGTLQSTYQPLLKQKSFMAGYRAWGKVDDGNGGIIDLPLMGHVVGAAYVRKAIQRGGFAWVPPGGVDTALRDVYEIVDPAYSDGELNQVVRDCGFNPVQYIPGYGFIVRTSRTHSTLQKYYSVHVRRMTNFFVSNFRQSFLWVEQEANNEETRRRVSNSLTFFAKDCYRNGAFSTRGGFDNNVAIKCDDQNNTQTMEDNRELQADFIFHPVEAIESGEINIMQTRDGLKVTDK